MSAHIAAMKITIPPPPQTIIATSISIETALTATQLYELLSRLCVYFFNNKNKFSCAHHRRVYAEFGWENEKKNAKLKTEYSPKITSFKHTLTLSHNQQVKYPFFFLFFDDLPNSKRT